MSNDLNNNTECILSAIDHLRKRKARPDMQRICRFLARKYALSPWFVQLEIDRLMGEGKVVKVEYKGSVSYRNAAKWWRHDFGGGAQLQASAANDMYSVLSCGNENKIVIRGCSNGRENLESLAMQTVESSSSAQNDADSKTQEHSAPPAEVTCVSKTTNAHKFKKRKKRGRPKSKLPPPIAPKIELEDKCDFCLLTRKCNKYGLPEDLLRCKDCGARAHPTCMNYGAELAARSSQYPWQCISCKTCSICEGLRDPDLMLVCDSCDKGYHMDCHKPVVYRKPLGKWKCQSCTVECGFSSDNCQITNEYRPSGVATVLGDFSNSLNLVNEKIDVLPKFLNGYPDIVPNASNWTILDVEEFISAVGFPEQALAFKEQEIDGKSLLLMKRSDVLTGLAIKLGPALKIYNHIKRLQMAKFNS